MERIAQFMKVSREQFASAWEFAAPNPYDELILPRRGTSGSAGYDFYSPIDFSLAPGEILKLPTGMRVQIAEGWFLMLCPRSSQGFKYRLQLYNTVGVVDADYFGTPNEGHIFIKIANANTEGKVLQIRKGEAFAQGVFLPFGITVDDEVTARRTGGFGSTNRI